MRDTNQLERENWRFRRALMLIEARCDSAKTADECTQAVGYTLAIIYAALRPDFLASKEGAGSE